MRQEGSILSPSWPHNRSKLINLETTQCHLAPPSSMFVFILALLMKEAALYGVFDVVIRPPN